MKDFVFKNNFFGSCTIVAGLVFGPRLQGAYELVCAFWDCFLVSFLIWVIKGQDLVQSPIS